MFSQNQSVANNRILSVFMVESIGLWYEFSPLLVVDNIRKWRFPASHLTDFHEIPLFPPLGKGEDYSFPL
jgi:hypothetical protein